MDTGSFTSGQLFIFIPSILMILGAITLFEFSENNPGKQSSVILLFLGALGLRIFMAQLDPVLNWWDEQYHALVAKNMIHHPFIPMLYKNPILPYNFQNWTANHIWLHKPPLFLWQMSWSMMFFGVNEFAIRLPSVLMSATVLLFVLRIGAIAVNERVGFYGALLSCFGFYGLSLVAGRALIDHNDVAFLFYVGASIWAWMEYSRSQRLIWLVLIGLIAGMAVLVKWFVGMLVFSGWAVSILADKSKRTDKRKYLNLILSLLICILLFAPWQFYIWKAFPEESRYEFEYASRHFSEVIEGHGGDIYFHFHALKALYGDGQFLPFLILLAFILLLFKVWKQEYRVGFFVFVAATYAFYTLAATKMTSFCFIVSPLVYLALGGLIDTLLSFLRSYSPRHRILVRLLSILFLTFISCKNFQFDKIRAGRTDWNDTEYQYRAFREKDIVIIRNLPNILPNDNYIVFNCREGESILIMFYTDFTAYDGIPSKEEVELLKKKGVNIAVFKSNELPDYLAFDPKVIKITPSVWSL